MLQISAWILYAKAWLHTEFRAVASGNKNQLVLIMLPYKGLNGVSWVNWSDYETCLQSYVPFPWACFCLDFFVLHAFTDHPQMFIISRYNQLGAILKTFFANQFLKIESFLKISVALIKVKSFVIAFGNTKNPHTKQIKWMSFPDTLILKIQSRCWTTKNHKQWRAERTKYNSTALHAADLGKFYFQKIFMSEAFLCICYSLILTFQQITLHWFYRVFTKLLDHSFRNDYWFHEVGE